MKKLLFSLLCLVSISAAAQDSTLKEYAGRYLFAPGSVVPSAEVTLNDNVLTVNSTQGSSVMQKMARDTFAIVSFDGMAYFYRNKEGQVAGVKVLVGDYVLEGVKEGITAFIHRKNYLVTTRPKAAK